MRIYDTVHVSQAGTATSILCLLSKRGLQYARRLLYRHVRVGIHSDNRPARKISHQLQALRRTLASNNAGQIAPACWVECLHLQRKAHAQYKLSKTVCKNILSIAYPSLQSLALVDFTTFDALRPKLLPNLKSLKIRSVEECVDGSAILWFILKMQKLDELVLDFPANLHCDAFFKPNGSKSCSMQMLHIKGGLDEWDSGSGLDFWSELLSIVEPYEIWIDFRDIQVGVASCPKNTTLTLFQAVQLLLDSMHHCIRKLKLCWQNSNVRPTIKVNPSSFGFLARSNILSL